MFNQFALQEEWYVHQCFDNMGDHIFSFPPAADSAGLLDCNDVAPWQVLYYTILYILCYLSYYTIYYTIQYYNIYYSILYYNLLPLAGPLP